LYRRAIKKSRTCPRPDLIMGSGSGAGHGRAPNRLAPGHKLGAFHLLFAITRAPLVALGGAKMAQPEGASWTEPRWQM
jgi:hypothetical protein